MNKYNRVKQIGEGAFGKAVLVKRKDTAKQFVIKEINITKMSPKEREEARKEMTVLAQLKHPNIVAYIESFEERGSLYIVMNFCAGGDLYGKINERRGQLFPESQILDWFVQLCLAVKHIHDRKILHRDIKSQNIFLTNTGKVQLGDFGIAKVLNTTAQLAHTCIGTPYYLSPEIVENMPYNNKSDIWSMGCVLYELSTLKHAFEAGNMKNLVLKIIRGSYPPLPPSFSYDLRGLIAQLFKRSPRDRPTVNAILKKNFIMQRVRKLLSAEDIENEFSHTVLHGQKIAKAVPSAPKPSADPVKKALPPRPGSANKKYDPAAVYGASVSSSRNKLTGEKKRPSTPGRQVPVPGQAEWERKRKERLDQEQKRRAEIRKREQEMNERRHRDLIEKQKREQINRAKEEGWKNLIMGQDDEKKVAQQVNRPKSPRPLPIPRVNQNERGNYEAYNEFLDKLHKKTPSPGVPQVGRNLNPNHIDVVNVIPPRPLPGPRNMAPPPQVLQQPYMAAVGVPAALDQAGRDRYSYNMQLGAQAAERARVVEDYMQRQREAAINKKRAQHDLYGHVAFRPASAERRTPVPAPRRGPSPGPGRGGGRGGGGGGGGVGGGWGGGGGGGGLGGGGGGGGGGGLIGRNREEQEYLDKLRQIRMQNMKDKRAIRGMNVAESADSDRSAQDAEERKKKVEALKNQAEQWAERKKGELEQQRRELLQGKSPVPITGALHAIGAGDKALKEPVLNEGGAKPAVPLTNAIAAIGGDVTPKPDPEVEERPKSVHQKKKEGILKKLNQKDAARRKWGTPASPAIPPDKVDDRPKWGPPASPTVNLAVEEQEAEPETSRSQWGDGKDLHLSQLPLEQTATQMDVTSSRDQVVKMTMDPESRETGARSQWMRRSDVVRALDNMPLCPDTMVIDSNAAPEGATGGATIVVTDKPTTASGATITVSDKAILKPEQQKEPPRPLPPERSGTIVIARESANEVPYAIPVISPGGGEEELPSSLHFQAVPAAAAQVLNSTSAVKLADPQSRLGEAELPSSIRYFDNEKEMDKSMSKQTATGGVNEVFKTPAPQQMDFPNDRTLGTLVEVSESQSLTSQEQENVQSQFKAYMQQMKAMKGDIKSRKSQNMSSSRKESVAKWLAQQQSASSGEKQSLNAKPLDRPSTISGIPKNMPVIDGPDEEREGRKTAKSKTASDINRDGAKSVQMHLTTGHFDLKDVQLLRTCSEPDLALLFRTAVMEGGDEDSGITATPVAPSTIRRHHSLDLSANTEMAKDLLTKDEDDEEDEFAEETIRLPEDDGDDEEDNEDADEEDEEEEGEDDDDEDMASMRETMQSLLVESDEEDSDKKKVSFRMSGGMEDNVDGQKTKSTTLKSSLKKKPAIESSGDGQGQRGRTKTDVLSSPVSDGGDEGDDEGDDNDDEDDEDEQEKLELAAALELENDDSDDETMFGDDGDYDRFGRLEEIRMELESQLGVEKLVAVYGVIQKMQEDDENNMVDGTKIATELLGPEKQHLFPKVFQLVMSDTAFIEDND